MNRIKRYLLAVTTLFAVSTVQAQTADELITKHLNAIGGKEKLSGITSLRLENTLQIMGNDAASTTVILNGKGYRNEAEFNGSKMIQVFTDKGGWMVNPMMGGTDPQAIPAEQAKAGQGQIYIVPLLDYAARGYKAEVVGQEKLGNVNAYKVKLTSKDNVSTTYYLDPATYYILQAVQTGDMMGQKMEVLTVFSDYKKSDYGFVYPQVMEIHFGEQFSLTSRTNKVEVNAPVDAALFEMKK